MKIIFHFLPLSFRIILGAAASAAGVIALVDRFFPGTSRLGIFAWMIGAITVTGLLLIAHFVIVAGRETWSTEQCVSDTQWLKLEGEPCESPPPGAPKSHEEPAMQYAQDQNFRRYR